MIDPTSPAATQPPPPDRRDAVLALLDDLMAAGVRVHADSRGRATVSTAGISPDLAGRADGLRADLDALAAWVHHDGGGRPRVTLATVLLAGLDALGFGLRAGPGMTVECSPAAPDHRPLVEALDRMRREIWFRLVVHMPPPAVAEGALREEASAPLLGLLKHCRSRVGKGRMGDRWERWAGALASAARGNAGAVRGDLKEVLAHCVREASRARARVERSWEADRRMRATLAVDRWEVRAEAVAEVIPTGRLEPRRLGSSR